MENFARMKMRHAKEISDLQNACQHVKISDWMDYMWAPGHFGSPVKVCSFCNKIIEQAEGIKPFIIKNEKESKK